MSLKEGVTLQITLIDVILLMNLQQDHFQVMCGLYAVAGVAKRREFLKFQMFAKSESCEVAAVCS
jgi:hypothetical protein